MYVFFINLPIKIKIGFNITKDEIKYENSGKTKEKLLLAQQLIVDLKNDLDKELLESQKEFSKIEPTIPKPLPFDRKIIFLPLQPSDSISIFLNFYYKFSFQRT